MGYLAHPMKSVSGLVWCGLLRFGFKEPRGFGYSAPDTLCWHKEYPESAFCFVVAGRDGFRRSRRLKPKNSSMNFSLFVGYNSNS